MDTAPTDREMEILKALWELEEGSVREVHEQLAPVSGLHFNTIQTQLRIMDNKGLVTHRKEGRTFIYQANCTREDVSSRFLNKVFDGAIDQLVLSMLDHQKVNAQELEQLEQLIAEKRKSKQSRKKQKGK